MVKIPAETKFVTPNNCATHIAIGVPIAVLIVRYPIFKRHSPLKLIPIYVSFTSMKKEQERNYFEGYEKMG